ncbi:hypothetical protein ACQPZP_06410 [Spirillospora sp. CA-142024]|uniref:hypothetical protein n=1 Tax=Spirillospora sp. CA-142024 TaxID=3240036 RepID=UPI003D91C9FB
MRRVVVLGGYGAVGREVVAGLRGHVPEVVVAGRDLAKARGVHYVDVSASREVLAGIAKLDRLATERSATAVLSVGLAPGITNLLAREFGGADLDIGVLLGSGERHGPSAVEWTLDSLAGLGESWRMRFPAVAVAAGGTVRAFTGRRQSRATGLVAATVVRRLAGMPPGVRHIEDAVGPGFLPDLAGPGFALTQYDAG